MATYRFTGKARQDLVDIIAYTQSHWGQPQAKAYITNLQSTCQLLADNPEIGRKCDEIAANVLSHPVKSHIIYYLRQDCNIVIVRILHKGMLPSKHLG